MYSHIIRKSSISSFRLPIGRFARGQFSVTYWKTRINILIIFFCFNFKIMVKGMLYKGKTISSKKERGVT